MFQLELVEKGYVKEKKASVKEFEVSHYITYSGIYSLSLG